MICIKNIAAIALLTCVSATTHANVGQDCEVQAGLPGDLAMDCTSAGTVIRHVRARIGSAEFALINGVWTDRQHTPDHPLLGIRRNSGAFTSLLNLLPTLRPAFDLGDHVIVNVGTYSVEVSARGLERATPAELASLMQAGQWTIGTL